jgi:transposase-like protein
VDAGRGDAPLTELRFRCSQCGTDRTDFVVTSRAKGEAISTPRHTRMSCVVICYVELGGANWGGWRYGKFYMDERRRR